MNQVVPELTKKYLKIWHLIKNWNNLQWKLDEEDDEEKLNFKLSLIFLKRSIIISKAKAFTLKGVT